MATAKNILTTPSDQASRLRKLAAQRHEAPERSAMTVAITSGKGGVGKTNIAVNLAICLASRGLRVTLVDADMGLANADVLMNVQPRYTLSHVVGGGRTIADICIEGPGGVRFVPGASGLGNLADLSEFERQHLLVQLQALERSADIVVFDCGAGISSNVTTFAAVADRVYVVTTPQPTALTDAYATVKTLHRCRCRGEQYLLVNMANSRREARATYDRVSSVARRFLDYSVADGGYMLHDSSVELAVQERVPFVVRYPGSNASACVAAVAKGLACVRGGQQVRGGFFRRFAGLFV